MSSASPVRILEDDTLDLDLMFSYDLFLECSNTNMNDLDNDDFAFAISSIAQHECLNLKIPTEGSPDGSPAGTNQPLEDTAQIDGGDNVWQPENDIAGLPPMVEEFLDAPSSWNPMYNSSLTLPDHSNEYNRDTIDLFTRLLGFLQCMGNRKTNRLQHQCKKVSIYYLRKANCGRHTSQKLAMKESKKPHENGRDPHNCLMNKLCVKTFMGATGTVKKKQNQSQRKDGIS